MYWCLYISASSVRKKVKLVLSRLKVKLSNLMCPCSKKRTDYVSSICAPQTFLQSLLLPLPPPRPPPPVAADYPYTTTSSTTIMYYNCFVVVVVHITVIIIILLIFFLFFLLLHFYYQIYQTATSSTISVKTMNL